jgi:hypothetical protein
MLFGISPQIRERHDASDFASPLSSDGPVGNHD